MSTRVATVVCRLTTLLAPTLVVFSLSFRPAAAQVLISVQGGVHAARLGRPERAVLVPDAGIALEGGKGEATTFGVRVGRWFTNRWGFDGGIAVSNNHSWNGGAPFGLMVEEFETCTVFTSATFRARLNPPTSRLGLNIGAGPALIFHEGSGTSLLTRNTDVGGLVDVVGSVGVSSRLALTINLQQYLFSSSFAQPYEIRSNRQDRSSAMSSSSSRDCHGGQSSESAPNSVAVPGADCMQLTGSRPGYDRPSAAFSTSEQRHAWFAPNRRSRGAARHYRS